MNPGVTVVADADEYWERYYSGQFRFGLGTEDILAVLGLIPPVDLWTDLGCGSESMLWAIALRARRLIAVDIDQRRLKILRQFARSGQPREVHATALQLCDRTGPYDFRMRCRSLAALVRADCLAEDLPASSGLISRSVALVTQFGLLGLCRDDSHFTTCFRTAHRLLAPGGWAVGANWLAHDASGRVELTEQLYRETARQTGLRLLLLKRTEIADPDFAAVWIYLGRMASCPPAAPYSLPHQAN
jgi:SAM-dependent methyltransferase